MVEFTDDNNLFGLKFKVNLHEFTQILEYLNMLNGDNDYDSLWKSSEGVKERNRIYKKFLLENDLTQKEGFTTIKQLMVINRLYKRQFKSDIK